MLQDATLRQVDKDFLLEEDGLDADLIAALDDAASQHLKGTREMYGGDLLYGAGRGAAEFAKRAQVHQAFLKHAGLFDDGIFEL